jgi:hypothetical protein
MMLAAMFSCGFEQNPVRASRQPVLNGYGKSPETLGFVGGFTKKTLISGQCRMDRAIQAP